MGIERLPPPTLIFQNYERILEKLRLIMKPYFWPQRDLQAPKPFHFAVPGQCRFLDSLKAPVFPVTARFPVVWIPLASGPCDKGSQACHREVVLRNRTGECRSETGEGRQPKKKANQTVAWSCRRTRGARVEPAGVPGWSRQTARALGSWPTAPIVASAGCFGKGSAPCV